MRVVHALQAFVAGQLDLPQLRSVLRGTVEFHSDGTQDEIRISGPPLPTVHLTADDVRRVLRRYLAGEIDERHVAAWASVLTLLDCFEVVDDGTTSDSIVWQALHHLAVPWISGALEPTAATAWLQRLTFMRAHDDELK